MPSEDIAYYCQKCLAANPLGQELCGRCGTRLMLIVEPPTARFDEMGGGVAHEEHLLERISALENRLLRVTEKIEQTLDLLLRQARNSYLDHALLETLLEVLNEAGTIDAVQVDALWRERCEQDTLIQESFLRHEELRREIIESDRGAEHLTFEKKIKDGFKEINEGKVKEGLRHLESAALLAPDSAPLYAFIGELLFEENRMAPARDYLMKALKRDADHPGLRLLAGIACAVSGEMEQAKALLMIFRERSIKSFAASFTLGMILAKEERWPESLEHFKQAHAARPSAEASYALGSIYFQLQRDRLCVRHLRQAIEMDERYADAFHLLGLALLRMKDKRGALECFQMAASLEPDEPLFCAMLKTSAREKRKFLTSALLFSMKSQRGNSLMPGRMRRLADLLKSDALMFLRQS